MKPIPTKDKSSNASYMRISEFRKSVKKSEAHKHNNYFEIIYLTKGSGFHFIDNRRYNVLPPVIFFIRKEQVHFFELQQDSDTEGYVLILKKTFIDKTLDGELKKLLTSASSLSCLYLSNISTITQLFELLLREHSDENENSFHISEGLLKALFVKIMETAKSSISTDKSKDKSSNETYQSFQELLSSGNTIKNKIAYYADLLKTSPQNLNAVCRKAVDLPATEVLAEFIISEAKRLLIYTDKTVSEISFILDFKDPSHFVKYFKRHTNLTPQFYRIQDI